VKLDRIRLVLHGGAGSVPGGNYSAVEAHMREQVETGRDRLLAGAAAIDVVAEIIRELERSGLYVAGRGASPNKDGEFELDAALMDGFTLKAGAVAAIRDCAAPIEVARRVMQATPHVLLASGGATEFAKSQGLESIADPVNWYTRACQDESNYLTDPSRGHGTVGCVARDHEGRLAAATSTAGVFGKMPGRCGDTAVIGAGCWADDVAAVCCTGEGEFFIRVAAAVQVAHRLRWAGQSLAEAGADVLDQIKRLGGSGGLIALDAEGNFIMPYNASGMKRAALMPDGSIFTAH